MVYVTHDQVEAMTMADKIVVLNAGQHRAGTATPMELYRRRRRTGSSPSFIGSPKMNLRRRARRRQKFNGATNDRHPARALPPSRATARTNGSGTVGVAEHLGSDTFLHIHCDSLGTINVRADGELAVRHGDTVWLTPEPAKIHRFDGDGLALH